MLTDFAGLQNRTVQCPYCGCTEVLLTEICQVTEVVKNEEIKVAEPHNLKIACVCKECGQIIREYDPKKLKRTEE